MDIQPVVPTPAPEIPPAPVPPVVSTERSRGIVFVLILVALFGILAYLAAVFITGNWWPLEEIVSTPAPTPTATPTPAAEAPWASFGSVTTGFGMRLPPGMTATESVGQNPADPSVKWTDISLKSPVLEGMITIADSLGVVGVRAAGDAHGSVSVGGMTISYSTGLQDHDGVTTGPERVWVAAFEANGRAYMLYFIAKDGVDRTQLVNTIMSTFSFPIGR